MIPGPLGIAHIAAAAMAAEIRSPFCSLQEDPFLLLESYGKSIEFLLRATAGRPLRRTWIEQSYGEKEITLLEEEVLPVTQQCLARVEESDQALESEQLKQAAGVMEQRQLLVEASHFGPGC